jgi:predicted site-specific integrase-resolvase
MPFVKAKEAARYFDVSSATIRKYARENSIYTEQLPSGRYRYWIDSDKPKPEINTDTKYTIAYARVSSYKQ